MPPRAPPRSRCQHQPDLVEHRSAVCRGGAGNEANGLLHSGGSGDHVKGAQPQERFGASVSRSDVCLGIVWSRRQGLNRDGRAAGDPAPGHAVRTTMPWA